MGTHHVAQLRKGVKEWNRWRSDFSVDSVDLCGAEFRYANLSAANLSGANLTGALLIGADLSYTNLTRADLSGAQCVGADLSGSVLIHTNFQLANLTNANFCNAFLGRTMFAHAILSGARFLDACTFLSPCSIDFGTLEASRSLPLGFLRGCGVTPTAIECLPSLLANSTIEFYSCFISYSRTDKAFALRLHDLLQARGIRCWLDEYEIYYGDPLHDSIHEGIKYRDKMLLCCSEASLKSWWVEREIEIALKKERDLSARLGRKVLVLIPLDLDGYILSGNCQSPSEALITSRATADFTGWETNNARFDATFEKLAKALRSDPHAREAPPDPKL